MLHIQTKNPLSVIRSAAVVCHNCSSRRSPHHHHPFLHLVTLPFISACCSQSIVAVVFVVSRLLMDRIAIRGYLQSAGRSTLKSSVHLRILADSLRGLFVKWRVGVGPLSPGNPDCGMGQSGHSCAALRTSSCRNMSPCDIIGMRCLVVWA